MAFPEVIAASLGGQSIRVATLVEFHFASGFKRVWNGSRKLVTNDAKIWEGLFGLGSIEGLEQSLNGSAPELRFSVSGVDAAFAAAVKAETEEYINRPATVFLQFFDPDWKPLDPPLAMAKGLMRSLKARKQSGEKGFVRTVTITAETPFGETKRRPPYAYCTDRDQKRRFPGDRAFEGTAGFPKTANFPDVGGD